MKPNTCLVIDTWEGQLEIDETVLKANGVAGISIRINDMSGGHHKDTGFDKQWSEAKNFVRFPYFVYNPWVDGVANYQWLVANMPPEAKSVAVDIEVRFSGITAAKYAGEVNKFLELCKPMWKTIIYTAQWFLDALSKWPTVDYWWAQYPNGATYFGNVKTWDQLKIALDALDKPFNVGSIPGTLKMWQFTGDYLTLPGNTRKMDVNIFYGTEKELADYFVCTVTIPEVPADNPTPKYMYVKCDLMALERPSRIRLGLPSTVRIQGTMSAINLSPEWIKFVYDIQPNPSYQFTSTYVLKPKVGWHNTGDPTRVEMLTFSGNIVEVSKIEGDKVFIKTFDASISPPIQIDLSKKMNPLIQLFSTQFSTWLDVGTNDRWPRTLLITKPGTAAWMSKSDLIPYEPVVKTVRVIALPWLNIRNTPTTATRVYGRKLYGQTTNLIATSTINGNIWGQLEDLSWVAIKYNGSNYTDWRL